MKYRRLVDYIRERAAKITANIRVCSKLSQEENEQIQSNVEYQAAMDIDRELDVAAGTTDPKTPHQFVEHLGNTIARERGTTRKKRARDQVNWMY